MNKPSLDPRIATLLASQPWATMVGFDEAGRGPLAGPVTAGAVILPDPQCIPGLADSKVLSESKREALVPQIQARAWWGLGWVGPQEIESLNIHHASLLAMLRAWEDLVGRFPAQAGAVLYGFSDGKFCPGVSFPCLAQVKGDSLIPAISAASIIAKVARDAYMVEQDALYPGYGFAKHKGYPSKEHRLAISRLGPCRIHRMTWIDPTLLSPSLETELPFEAPS